FFSSRRRHTRSKRDWIQTCALPISSGSAFFTFALLAGINDGLLPADEYQETALKGWDYLSNVALHENGKIGYVQPVGGAAGKAASYENTQDFGVGASLLAACELFKMNKN